MSNSTSEHVHQENSLEHDEARIELCSIVKNLLKLVDNTVGGVTERYTKVVPVVKRRLGYDENADAKLEERTCQSSWCCS